MNRVEKDEITKEVENDFKRFTMLARDIINNVGYIDAHWLERVLGEWLVLKLTVANFAGMDADTNWKRVAGYEVALKSSNGLLAVLEEWDGCDSVHLLGEYKKHLEVLMDEIEVSSE